MTHSETAAEGDEKLVNACLRVRPSTLEWFKRWAKGQERTASAQLRIELERLRADDEASA